MDIFTQEHSMVRKMYETTEQADYWLNAIDTTKLSPFMMQVVEDVSYFFLATSSKDGRVNVNFKGGKKKKLLKVLDANRIIFADFDGNGILHSIGDIQTNPHVGLLIIDFCKDIRMKINGRATIIDDKEEISKYFDIFDSFEFRRLIRVDIEYVIPNCSSRLQVVREEILHSHMYTLL